MNLIRLSASTLTVAAGSAAAYVGLLDLGSPEARTIAGTLAATAGTLLGFVVAALSILASVGNSKFVHNTRLTGHYRHLIHALFGTAVMFLASLVLAISSLFMTEQALVYCVLASTSAFIVSCVAFGSAGRKFYLFVTLID